MDNHKGREKKSRKYQTEQDAKHGEPHIYTGRFSHELLHGRNDVVNLGTGHLVNALAALPKVKRWHRADAFPLHQRRRVGVCVAHNLTKHDRRVLVRESVILGGDHLRSGGEGNGDGGQSVQGVVWVG